MPSTSGWYTIFGLIIKIPNDLKYLIIRILLQEEWGIENLGRAPIRGHQKSVGLWPSRASPWETGRGGGEKKGNKASFVNFKTASMGETPTPQKSKIGFLDHCCLASGFRHGYDQQVMNWQPWCMCLKVCWLLSL